jgi:DNA-binding response OmpR family regulator
MRLLIVEDDVVLAEFLSEGLTEEGHVVGVEHDGVTGELAAQSGDYDALVLDVFFCLLPTVSIWGRSWRPERSTAVHYGDLCERGNARDVGRRERLEHERT